MRGRPSSIEPPTWQAPKDNRITVKLRNITPIFGGGYEAREVDTACLIRPAAIRGQLRFWWRATVGARCATAQQLFAEEEKVWGSARKKGAVSIGVRVSTREQDAQRVRIDRCPGVPAYVREILTQERASTEHEKDGLYPWVYQHIEFTVTISAKTADVMSDASKALRAFVLYGGVGGRTRRGFGCLDWDELPESPASLAARPSDSRWPPFGCPSLVGARLYVGAEGDAAQSWATAVAMLSKFRRAVAPDSKTVRPGKGQFSHSPWPEADMIRRLRGFRQLNSSSGDVQGDLPFPRAQLGLPLKLQSLRDHAGCFGKAELKLRIGGKLIDRLASPVIVRPIMVGSSWRAALLILNSSPIPSGNLVLDGNETKQLSVACGGWPVSLYKDGTEIAFSHGGKDVLDALAKFITLPGAGWRAERIDGL